MKRESTKIGRSFYLNYACKIFLRNKLISFLFIFQLFSFGAVAQKTIRGTVKNPNGEALTGVTIRLNGTSVGTTTDSKGHYNLRVLADTGTLIFSYIGYVTRAVPVNNSNIVDITLQENAAGLNEVMVVGYGEQKKADLTGAVDQIDSKYFENRPVPNVSRALQGAIPNLNIDYSDGRPTTSPAWNIRGLTSIGAGGEALILIDGVVGDPSDLNPNDIQSVTVLKDAASAAIYGSRGAFGVVLITTKKPHQASPSITYSGSYSTSQPTAVPHLVTDGYLWAKMFNETYNAWYDYSQSPTTVGGSGLIFSTTYLDSLKYRSEHPGVLPTVTVDPSTGNYVYYGNTDWYKELYVDRIPAMEHSLMISGGSEKIDYLVSGRIYEQGGLFRIRSDKYNRYNLRFKGGIQVTDWLKINGGTDFSSYRYTDPFGSNNIWNTLNVSGYGAPMAVLFNPDGTLTRTAALSVGSLYGENQTRTQQNFIQNNVSFVATLIKNTLDIRGDFTYQNTVQETDVKTVPIQYSVKPNEISEIGSSLLGKTITKQNYFAYNLYANYTHSFGNHNIKVLIGDNLEIDRIGKLGASKDDLLVPELSDLNLAVGQNSTIVGGGSEWATSGVFSRINYNFKDKYLVEINGRYDGSSKFPPSKQFGFFPSVSAGWRLSEENFMKNTRNWLDNFKIRASYGSLGNSQIDPYLYLEQLKANKSKVIVGGVLPYYISNPAALPDNFTWETATTLDFGADIAMFNSKITASFDWYRRQTSNMITPGPILPVVFGASIPKGNYADLSTKGFELSLNWSDQIKLRKPISYSIRLTLADNVAYITRYNNPQGLISPDPYTFVTNYYSGLRVGDIWGYVTEGLFTSEDDIKNHADQSAILVSSGNKILPGDIKFKDLNHDGKVNKGGQTLQDHGDWIIIGNSQPRFPFGITTNVDWNNFSLSAFFQGVGKRDWYPSYGATAFWGQYSVWYGSIPKHTLKNNWTLDGNNPNSYWPRYEAPLPYGEREMQPQTRYLQNVSYIRLKNLTISYSLPKALAKKLKLVDVQFYLSGQNIWTYSPIYKLTKDIDPETVEPAPGSSYDANTYPMLKTYTFGITLKL